MAALWKKLTTAADYPIVVAQYTRADYGAGQEENLHWALAVLLHEAQQKGPVYQAIDRHYSDGRGVVWSLWADEGALHDGKRCIGAVCIGRVTKDQARELDATLRGNLPVVKFPGWNCRDWVMEGIALMHAKGWVTADIPEQETLLRALRTASLPSIEAYKQNKFPVVVPLA